MKTRYDAGVRGKRMELRIGDVVMVKRHGHLPKFKKRWAGPSPVTWVGSDGAVEVFVDGRLRLYSIDDVAKRN